VLPTPLSGTDEGITLAEDLRASHPDIGVVVLSQFADPIYALALFDRGSDGRAYLLKERVHNRAELTAAVHAVADGGSMVDSKIVDGLVRARPAADRSALDELTAREREVLSEIAQGKSNMAIAESLFLSARAVEKHIDLIFLKLGLAEAEDRRELTRQSDADAALRRDRRANRHSGGTWVVGRPSDVSMGNAVPIRVVLADDSLVVRDVLAQILNRSPDIDVVATAVDEPTLLAAIEETRPDVIVTDVRMPPTGTDEGVRIAARLAARTAAGSCRR